MQDGHTSPHLYLINTPPTQESPNPPSGAKTHPYVTENPPLLEENPPLRRGITRGKGTRERTVGKQTETRVTRVTLWRPV